MLVTLFLFALIKHICRLCVCWRAYVRACWSVGVVRCPLHPHSHEFVMTKSISHYLLWGCRFCVLLLPPPLPLSLRRPSLFGSIDKQQPGLALQTSPERGRSHIPKDIFIRRLRKRNSFLCVSLSLHCAPCSRIVSFFSIGFPLNRAPMFFPHVQLCFSIVFLCLLFPCAFLWSRSVGLLSWCRLQCHLKRRMVMTWVYEVLLSAFWTLVFVPGMQSVSIRKIVTGRCAMHADVASHRGISLKTSSSHGRTHNP